ncbi:hypothetical protein [Streptomyces sp.]|uniref:hypothetical protein n=1 Tax=Streptomyces sp. TaxID=1931 RepID=UPI002F3F2CB6
MDSTSFTAEHRRELEARLWANIGLLSGMGFAEVDEDTSVSRAPMAPVRALGTKAPLGNAA